MKWLREFTLFRRVDILSFVVGFAIGAGILGLPISFGCSGAGFLPSLAMLVIVLFFQVVTSLYVVEALDVYGPYEYPQLMGVGLGRAAELAALLSILLELAGAMTAYIIFGGEALYTLSHGAVSKDLGMLLYWVFGTLITIFGARAVARAEEAMVAMIMLLLAMNIWMCLSSPYASLSNLLWGDWSKMFSVFGIVLFAYAIHAAIPTAYRTIGMDTEYGKVLTLGLCISCLTYVAWSASYMAILSPSDYTKTFVGALTGRVYHGLNGLPAPIAVAELGKIESAAMLGYTFGFFTTVTSYIAAAHTTAEILYQYGAKGIGGRKIVVLLSCLPPLALAFTHLGNFIQWLDFAGAIGASLYTGILPSILGIKLRIRNPPGFKPHMPGGIPLAIASLLFYAYGMAWFIQHPGG